MLDVDIRGLEDTVLDLKRNLPDALLDVAIEAREDAEGYARQLLELQVYSQPQAGSYERTRKLIGSVEGYVVKNPNGFDVVLEARGGNQGKNYGLFVERGTLSSRVDESVIVADAQESQGLEPLDYARGQKGAKPRPSVIPALAQVERDLTEAVLEAVDRVARG